MKITAASVHVVPTDWRRAVIVEIETDAGLTGIGEVGIAYGAGTRAAAFMAAEMAERFLLGRDPSPVERLWSDIYDQGFWTKGGGANPIAALSGLEQALWDHPAATVADFLTAVLTRFGNPRFSLKRSRSNHRNRPTRCTR